MANKKCPKCKTLMKEIKEYSSLAWVCPKCGYAEATTTSKPIYDDETYYSIVLLENDPSNLLIVKVLSRLTGLNYIETKNLINNPKDIFNGRAYEVLERKKNLDEIGVNYIIIPEFPY